MGGHLDYGPAGHRNRFFAGQHQSQVCYVLLGTRLRVSLRCGELQVLVGFRGQGEDESGVGVKKTWNRLVPEFGGHFWPLLLTRYIARVRFWPRNSGTARREQNGPSVLFWEVGGGTEAVVLSPLSRGSVLTPRQRSPQSQVVDRASGFLEQGLVGTVMTWK